MKTKKLKSEFIESLKLNFFLHRSFTLSCRQAASPSCSRSDGYVTTSRCLSSLSAAASRSQSLSRLPQPRSPVAVQPTHGLRRSVSLTLSPARHSACLTPLWPLPLSLLFVHCHSPLLSTVLLSPIPLSSLPLFVRPV
jgi:hypothetical protein